MIILTKLPSEGFDTLPTPARLLNDRVDSQRLAQDVHCGERRSSEASPDQPIWGVERRESDNLPGKATPAPYARQGRRPVELSDQSSPDQRIMRAIQKGAVSRLS